MALFEPVVDASPRRCRQPGPALSGGPTGSYMLELTTVGDTFAVAYDGVTVRDYDGLDAGRDYSYDGLSFRTLDVPAGELVATVATVNDVHFGETICGFDSNNPDAGPVFSVDEGEPPYPETMNAGAVEDIARRVPRADAIVVKGDLTNGGLAEEYEAFVACYRGAFGDRMHHIRGNHDAYHHERVAPEGPFRVDLEGVVLAVLDTTVPGRAGGGLDRGQLEWLDAVLGEADRGANHALVFGHHHPWSPDSTRRPEPGSYFGIEPPDSEALVAVVARHPSVLGYFCGHTHRNRVRHFTATGDMPWAEVACVKDFPGAWAEYRIHEGGALQIVHRIRRPDALAWTERTRGMFDGAYTGYAFGAISDRCFPITRRSSTGQIA